MNQITSSYTEAPAPVGASVCPFPGCGRPARTKGLCQSHYLMESRGEDLRPIRALSLKGQKPPCRMGGCETTSHAQGLCTKHLAALRKYGDPGRAGIGRGAGPKRTSDRLEKGPCAVEGCQRQTKGFMAHCGMHYARLRKTGEVGPVESTMAPWGEARRLNKEGYVVISGGKLEHRVMWEQANRPLLPGETVHHKNGVRDDNRLDNFELWVSFQPAGQRPEDLLAWADEVFRRYR